RGDGETGHGGPEFRGDEEQAHLEAHALLHRADDVQGQGPAVLHPARAGGRRQRADRRVPLPRIPAGRGRTTGLPHHASDALGRRRPSRHPPDRPVDDAAPSAARVPAAALHAPDRHPGRSEEEAEEEIVRTAMAQTGAGQKPDTTFYRTQQGVGFNARVEPVWHTYSQIETSLGFFDRRRERKKVEHVLDSIQSAIVGQKGNPAGWDKTTGDCVAHLRVAKMGLVKELKNWLKVHTDGTAEANWPHLHVLRDRPCLMVPVPFTRPFPADPGGGEEPIPVASSVSVRDELAAINKRFRI